jgi:hypothetical protein
MMEPFLSEEFRQMAYEIIDLFGKEYIIRRPTPTTPDPDRPTYVVMTTQDFPCLAALTAFTEEQIKMLQVLREDMQAIVAWSDQLPEKIVPGDLLVDGTKEYTIVPPESVYTVNGETVAWQMIVRR